MTQLPHPSSPHALVFDVGGTSLRAALYDPEARQILRRIHGPAPSHERLPALDAPALRGALLDAMAAMGRELSGEAAPARVVAAMPGPVDARGRVLSCPTLWGDLPTGIVDMRAELERRFPRSSVHVLNDVTAAGYRYIEAGDESLCVVTVSSGIGNKVFLSGKPVLGTGYRGGELGHWRVDLSAEAPLCDCGARGHLGAIASGRGVLRLSSARARAQPEAFLRSTLGRSEDPEQIDDRALAAAFRAGDPWVRAVVRDAARPLGQALAAVHLTTGLERFILIGGFALALGEPYRAELVAAAAACAWSRGQDWDEAIALGDPGEAIGLLGAGRYASMAS
jgi:glucokinase